MVLVMLGTQNNSFHRLLEEVQKCIDEKIISGEVIVQAGATKFQSEDMKIFKLISADELNKHIDQADYVITHGGVGSIVNCLKKGKKVIAVPRYHKYGEHVNDHQLQIIENFDKQGFIIGVKETQELKTAIEKLDKFTPQKFISNNEKVINIIENYIDNDKKILFSAHSLDVGGIEKALVAIANKLQGLGYRVTIALEKKEGIFLEELNKNIKIITYCPSDCSNVLLRKISNLFKQIKFKLKYKNKFDFSASFATYSIPASFVARVASKNAHLWGHADYLTLFNENEEETKKFFIERKYEKFQKVIFVSNEGKESFIKLFPQMKEKTDVINNIIDGNKIKKLSNEAIEHVNLDNEQLKKEETSNLDNKNVETMKCTTFLNVGRHDEKQKRLTRLIEAAEMLKKDKYNFKILFVGEGPETNKYKDMVKEKDLGENIIFLGKKQNPYPYFKISDCVILTSDYEGYPVVFLESFILNKPIITTKVSDYEEVKNGFGLVTEKTVEDIYDKMKIFIEQGYKIEKKFDYDQYNQNILNKLQELINNRVNKI